MKFARINTDEREICRIADICGSLEVGKQADLAILESDPTEITPTEIESIKVSETWLAGEQKLGA